MSAADRQDWTQDGSFVDSGGEAVRAYDDVTLLSSVPVVRQGGGVPLDTVPRGTQATVLFFTTAPPVELDLECYVGDGFYFARSGADNVHLAVRAEDKNA